MSEQQPQPASSKDARRQAKADEAAAKARAKAQRPWYQKKRFVIPLVLLLLVVVVSITSRDDGDDGELDVAATEQTATEDPTGDEQPAEDSDPPADEEAAEADEVVEEEDVPDETPDDAEFARIGEEARDGQFAFVVDDFECVGDTIAAENEFVDDAQAQGQFCLLTLTVENIGDQEQSLFASNQYLYDAEERRFSASSDFDVIMAMDTPVYDSINPGNSISGTLVFDIPEGADIEFAELHDSAFSGGVLVDLR
jgi:hypothetical protein